MKKVLLIAIVLVPLLFLSGCKWQFLAPRVIPNTYESTYDVNVSIGPDGAKHYFWVECSTEGY